MDGWIDEWKAVASISGVHWTEGGMENSEEEEEKETGNKATGGRERRRGEE